MDHKKSVRGGGGGGEYQFVPNFCENLYEETNNSLRSYSHFLWPYVPQVYRAIALLFTFSNQTHNFISSSWALKIACSQKSKSISDIGSSDIVSFICWSHLSMVSY